MDCDACRAALSALLDGEQPPVPCGEDELAAHLAACPACRAWQAAAGRLDELVQRAPGPRDEGSEALLARLRLPEQRAAGGGQDPEVLGSR